MLSKQIELEKRITDASVNNYRAEIKKAKLNNTFGCTGCSTKLMSIILEDFVQAINLYIQNKPLTHASLIIKRINDVNSVAFITSKVIFNSLWSDFSIQSIYKSIGQALEFEYKMRLYKKENIKYYNQIQKDLNKKNTKAARKKTITSAVFQKRLNFHVDSWNFCEKLQTGLVLTNIFVKTTNLAEFQDKYIENKHIKKLIPTKKLMDITDKISEKLEILQPFFLPMLCEPKAWTSVFDGGYISPYIKTNKLIKNNDKDYLSKLENLDIPEVYNAVNHLQNTQWKINGRVLDVVKKLWMNGGNIAELPPRIDEALPPFPLPEKDKNSKLKKSEIKLIKNWKQKTTEIHTKNARNRSLRLLISRILDIANQFEKYDKIWFPYQMDFRGRLYPIPVLLQPQGSDLSKGLLQFSNGKPVDKNSIKWLQIHGANVYGYDKDSYEKRIEWIENRHPEIQSYAQNPMENRGWTYADKPFQFLAFCFEYNEYLKSPDNFKSYLPILLDGTCNGLQHYSALLRDYVSGCAVNLVNSNKPNDIYATVAQRLEEKLTNITKQKDANIKSKKLAKSWLKLGINRKLTKRPVMVLPYGGTVLSCREYISEYLSDNYSTDYLKNNFKQKDISECIFTSSIWLSKYLWQSIQETLKSAVTAMSYLKKIAKFKTSQDKFLEWETPLGLIIRQGYTLRARKEIKTELYGSIIKTSINTETKNFDSKRQLNGICPNFIHSLDAACLMLYVNKCKKEGITSLMTIHDCYGTHACDTETSARLLREAFVEIYRKPVLENFTYSILENSSKAPEIPEKGDLNIEDVLKSEYFFN